MVTCGTETVTGDVSGLLQYRASTGEAPRMQEMLPGESAAGSYVFSIRDGVQPVELVFELGGNGNIRCGSSAILRDVPNQIRLDVRDFPVTQIRRPR